MLGTSVYAQQLERSSISPAGNFIKVDGIEFHWNLGELIMATHQINSENFITQGFIQPMVDEFVGLPPDIRAFGKLRIFPNPGKGRFNLEINQMLHGVYTIEVFDVFGRMMYIKNYVEVKDDVCSFILDVPELAEGVYFAQISSLEKKFEFQNLNSKKSVVKFQVLR